MLLYVYIYFVGNFLLLFIKNVLIIFILFDEVSNFCNRILTNEKPEFVVKNC